MRVSVGGCVGDGAQIRDMGLRHAGDALMEKAVCETQRLLSQLTRGYRPDLEFILMEIYTADMAYGDVRELADGTDTRYAAQFFLATAWEDFRPDILKYV